MNQRKTKLPQQSAPKLLLSILLLLTLAFSAGSQEKPSTADVKKRVDAFLGKLTLEEKISLIGGIHDFYTQAIPRLGIPQFRMSDGPMGEGDKQIEYTEGIFVGYRGYEKSATKPLFPFGYGLSYTTFAYPDLKIAPAAKGSEAVLAVSFRVKNTGSRGGAEVAQVYVGDSHAPVPRPPKELKGFSKISLRPGESKSVTVLLNTRAFSYYDVAKHDWTAAPGDFAIIVGSSSVDIRLQGKYSLDFGEEHR